MKKRISMIAFAITVILSNADAQVTNVPQDTLVKNNINTLKDLKKVELGDIDPGTRMVLDPSTTPMYNENFVLIKEGEFMKIMMSGDFIPEPYIDSNKVVKAFVLRKATELEKEKMQNPGQNNKSELIGKEAFPFSVTDISGNKYSLEKLKGKVIVINFWFVECKPCVMEIPELNDLVEKYKGKEVVFLGFATNDKSKIESFLKTKTYKYNIIAESKEVAGLFKVNSYPTNLIIDTNSIISYYITGLGPTTVKDLDKQIESLMK
ncbi:MAG: TlpA disulfide reductase family protein [Cyclobacteriaceae bacterium]|nr:TlpA disulfide reductase family protein [Cyclobacteriaceae bacterium]